MKLKLIVLSPILLANIALCQEESRSINNGGGGGFNLPPGLLRRQGGLPIPPLSLGGGIGQLSGGNNQLRGDNINVNRANLEKGPLTLVNGQLRPLNSLNENRQPLPPQAASPNLPLPPVRDSNYFPSNQGGNFAPSPTQQQRPPPGLGSGRRQGPWRPEIHLTKLPPSASQDFNPNSQDFNANIDFNEGSNTNGGGNNRRTNLRPFDISGGDFSQLPPGPYYPPSSTDPVRPEPGDWSTKVSNSAAGID